MKNRRLNGIAHKSCKSMTMDLKKLLPFCLLLIGCKDNFIYHPNEIRPSEKNLNLRNLQKLSQLSPKDTFNFILTGDTQLANAELEDFIQHVNARDDIEFMIINGDLTDFGRNYEYNLLARQLLKLDIPFISVIGNHDMLGNGRMIYNEMFGPENFTFNYGLNRFVIINSNFREGSGSEELPDLNWLQQAVTGGASTSNTFVASHIAPFSADFNPAKEQQYHDIISTEPTLRLSMHGHDHHFSITQPYDDVRYVVAGAMSYRNYALVSVKGTSVTINKIEF